MPYVHLAGQLLQPPRAFGCWRSLSILKLNWSEISDWAPCYSKLLLPDCCHRNGLLNYPSIPHFHHMCTIQHLLFQDPRRQISDRSASWDAGLDYLDLHLVKARLIAVPFKLQFWHCKVHISRQMWQTECHIRSMTSCNCVRDCASL